MSDGARPPLDLAARVTRLLQEEQDRRLVDSAVRQGRLTAAQAAEAAREAEGSGASIAAVAVRRGWLDAAALKEASAALAREDFERPAAARPAALPEEARAHAADPERVLGDHVLVARVGHGGAGEVWRAWDRKLARWVAVKVARAPEGSRTARERFRREARAAARLRHPHIVPVHDAAEQDGRAFTVMPLVDGRSAGEMPLTAARAVEVMATVAEAVQHAHDHGVIHRDLKPSNIMIDGAGHVWVFDFGLVFLDDGASRLTLPGDVLGTAAYMSPEQALGKPEGSEAPTDVYALGATLYELATGRPPFAGASIAEIVHKVVNEEPTPPRRLGPEASGAIREDLETVILRAMAKDPRRRYPSAAALAADLRRIQRGEPIAARRAGFGERLVGRARRSPATTAATAVAVGALLAAAAIWRADREERRRALAAGADFVRTATQMRADGDDEGYWSLLRDFASLQVEGAADREGKPVPARALKAFADLVGDRSPYLGALPTSAFMRAHRFSTPAGPVIVMWSEWDREVRVNGSHEGFDAEGARLPPAARYALGARPLFVRGAVEIAELGDPPIADSRADFSLQQGRTGWSYRAERPDGTHAELHPGDGGETGPAWRLPGATHLRIARHNQHPAREGVVRSYRAAAAARVRIRGYFDHGGPSGRGDGTVNVVRHNGAILWRREIRSAREGFDLTRDLAAGDVLDFATFQGENDQFDVTSLHVVLVRAR